MSVIIFEAIRYLFFADVGVLIRSITVNHSVLLLEIYKYALLIFILGSPFFVWIYSY